MLQIAGKSATLGTLDGGAGKLSAQKRVFAVILVVPSIIVGTMEIDSRSISSVDSALICSGIEHPSLSIRRKKL